MHKAAWRRWFAGASVQPHLVQYEDLITDPAGVTRPGTRRQADALNADWIARYRAIADTSARDGGGPGAGTGQG